MSFDRAVFRRLPPCGQRCTFWLLTMLIATAAAEQPPLLPTGERPCYFAEPMSGRKVLSYEIALPTEDGEKPTFTIPDDCSAVNEAFDNGRAYKGSIMDRRFWMKVTSDCRYYQLLRRHPIWEIQDFVSDFDFRNARLDLLPYDQDCLVVDGARAHGDCRPTFVDLFGDLRQFPLVEPLPDVHPDDTDEACRLNEGIFTGVIYADAHGLHCISRDGAPSLRLVGVDFADINGDGYMDAVLRLLPTGPGHLRRTILLPVTRFSADGGLKIPPMR